ncbi:hypothetical protein BDV30DRAFT_90274 [Aspergillus minisclerotigenes]|uniref:Uncharacterized protein n=1 Tax=Aspergillus minisclerotigenes TaxID=656917 RepID=A0A5N6J9F6_9EURO|nr:hypothetical protein BDV30DRAFT_90274 [Aspergillus minisclerotigenes]
MSAARRKHRLGPSMRLILTRGAQVICLSQPSHFFLSRADFKTHESFDTHYWLVCNSAHSLNYYSLFIFCVLRRNNPRPLVSLVVPRSQGYGPFQGKILNNYLQSWVCALSIS